MSSDWNSANDTLAALRASYMTVPEKETLAAQERMALNPRQVELAVLLEVIDLPNHLTPAELILRLSGERNEEKQLEEAIRGLKTSDLLRCIGNTVAPTDAAVRAAELLML